ncbi:YraN family protein [Candidatus Kaiserbacteria bacterium]|nr:YraN family protein [Candidatus Kaiserbacteria bacterium]
MKQIHKRGLKNQIGAYGETIAAEYLNKKGFKIIGINYLKKWGEIDLIAKNKDIVHFIEVKTVSHETISDLKQAISRGTYRPEEQAHNQKLLKVARTAETWLVENNWNGNWQIDVVAVRVVTREKYATIKYIDNIILE